jgi:hypothetical protein
MKSKYTNPVATPEFVGQEGTVYLICFGGAYHHARHYIGWCKEGEEERRFEQHRKGKSAGGSNLVKAAVEFGLPAFIARTWSGKSRSFERALKNQRNAPRFCPHCNGEMCDTE